MQNKNALDKDIWFLSVGLSDNCAMLQRNSYFLQVRNLWLAIEKEVKNCKQNCKMGMLEAAHTAKEIFIMSNELGHSIDNIENKLKWIIGTHGK